MEEANERLVRLYFESKGFFVRTNYKVKIETNRYLEADVIAIRIVDKHNDKLPNAIMAEVKAWRISPNVISDLFKKSESKLNPKRQKQDASKLKLINNPKDREEFFNKLREDFGKNFSFFIIAKEFGGKHKNLMQDYFRRKDIYFISLEEVVQGVYNYALSHSYSNDSELQLIRIIKKVQEKIKPNK